MNKAEEELIKKHNKGIALHFADETQMNEFLQQYAQQEAIELLKYAMDLDYEEAMAWWNDRQDWIKEQEEQ